MRFAIILLLLCLASTDVFAQRDVLRNDKTVNVVPAERFQAEERIKKFVDAVIGGFSEDAADLVAYPLIVELPTRKKIIARDRQAFIRQWSKIFTKPFVKHIRDHQPLTVNSDELHPLCSVAEGALWFDATGKLQVIKVKTF